MPGENRTIWTIGHSTRLLEEFVGILRAFNIELIADIRRFPGSRKFPQFNKESLEVSLPKNNIEYVHIEDLGGRRTENPNSGNKGWRNISFRSYADYMETDTFKDGLKELTELALKRRTAFMCSEAVWWRCHRSMVSDYLKLQGWKVIHIMKIDKATEHSYTAPARIVDNELNYGIDPD
jgi:uncharacterized protein (DUF488 family)